MNHEEGKAIYIAVLLRALLLIIVFVLLMSTYAYTVPFLGGR